MRLAAFLASRPPVFTVGLAIALLLLVGAFDWVTGPELGTSIFYLAPILLVAQRSGRWPGIAMAIAAALTWLAADIATGRNDLRLLLHYWNAAVRCSFFILIVALFTALRREQVSARRDPLTGVGNRQVLHEALASEIARARRFRRPLSCALLDVDRFKAINDSLGHPAGDRVLRAIGEQLLAHTRAIDMVARYGGDEFVLLLPETGEAAARGVVQRIQSGLAASAAGRPLVSFSIGVVTFERPPEDADEVLARADAALYAAKRAGGATVQHDTVA